MRKRMRRDSGTLLVAGRHDGLDLDRALGRVDHARELGQDAVARGVDDAAAVAADQRQDHRLVPLEVADRRGLVLAHEAAVAGDVGGQNGGEPSLHRGILVHSLFSCAARGTRWAALWHITRVTLRAFSGQGSYAMRRSVTHQPGGSPWSWVCSPCRHIPRSARSTTGTSGTSRCCGGPMSWATRRRGSGSTTRRRGSPTRRRISSSPRGSCRRRTSGSGRAASCCRSIIRPSSPIAWRCSTTWRRGGSTSASRRAGCPATGRCSTSTAWRA